MRPTDLIAVFGPPFDAAGVEWMVAGGVASIVSGEPRFTQDLDIVAGITPADADRFARQFPDPEFYCAPPDVIAAEASREHPGHFNVLHNPTGARARQQGASERHLRDIRTMLRVPGPEIDVAALARDAEDLGLADVWREVESLRD